MRSLVGFIFLFLFVVIFEASASVHYTVKRGDSLIGISKKLGISTKAIKKLNPSVNWLKIKPGEKIAIPAPKPKKILYTVKKGDSLRQIAEKFGVTLESLKKSNPKLAWPIIKPNDTVVIIKKTGFDISKNSKGCYFYTAKKDDSLDKIAKKFHVNIKDVKRLNPDINWSKIMPNEKIVVKDLKTCKQSIRQKKMAKVRYIVKKGDTLNDISRKFGITLNDIKKLNIGVTDIIKPGDTIDLPKDVVDNWEAAQKKKQKHTAPNFSFKHLVYSSAYIIKRGDTLLKIAKKFNTTVATLKMINNLNNSLVRAGNTLFVPNQDTAERIKEELRYSLINEQRGALVKYAEKFLGKPYKFGGTSLQHGIDCSAFVQKVFRKFDIDMPRTAQSQYEKAGVFVPADRLKKGDLLFFHTLDYSKVTHVGIYIGDDYFIHAAGSHKGIRISKLDGYFKKTLVGAKRVLGVDNRYAYFRGRSG